MPRTASYDRARVPWNEWIRTVEVEPSLYAADFARLGEQIDVLLRAGARVFHFDTGDGHFVPPVTMGPIVLDSIAEQIHQGGGVIDCHLMVDNPVHHFPQFAASGGDSVTFHVEVAADPAAVIRAAREHELEVGVAFNPETEPSVAAAAAEGADFVLCMSIHPGYSGQAFMPEALERIATLRTLLPDGVRIQVDGGVGSENVRELREAGADLFVAGTSIFGREDLTRAYRRLVQTLA
jgi:ribulose-phosphate 3-epimerase